MIVEKEEYQQIHRHTIRNLGEIQESGMCACFDCCRRFEASEVEEWADKGQTALCPYCGTDAVIGDASGIALTDKLINELHKYYF